jgi:hypothetical protein
MMKKLVLITLTMSLVYLLSGCGLTPNLLNEEFLNDTGLIVTPDGQTAPEDPNYILIRVNNSTDYPITIQVAFERGASGVMESILFEQLAAQQVVGQLIDDCAGTNAPRYIKIDDISDNMTGLPYAYLWVNGMPKLIANRMGTVNYTTDPNGTGYMGGDTLEIYVRQSQYTDNEYEAVGILYR